MSTHFQDATVTLHHGDCLDVLRELPDCSVDSVVTDPPYGLEFMGKEWDGADGFRRSLNLADVGRDNAFGRTSRTSPEYNTGRGARVLTERATELTERGQGHSTSAGPYLASGVDSVRVAGRPFQEWCEAWATECLRVLKPGGHMLAFGGTRTWHRLACAVEDAGFEKRDSIAWLYGSGFPKSADTAKAIDRHFGVDPDDHPSPYTPEAQQWVGWGTALKPAFEPIVVARKPLIGTVAANVLKHGTGALNIDGSRIGTTDKLSGGHGSAGQQMSDGWERPWMSDPDAVAANAARAREAQAKAETLGRWPANVILDESQAAALDEQSGDLTSGANPTRRGSDKFRNAYGDFAGQEECTPARGVDSGGASRFFYCAKADQGERITHDGIAHPTVKPLNLMRYLVRLVTPPGGIVLDPFGGSGTTAEACILEGFRCVVIEREADYLPLITQRINRRRNPVAYIRAAGDQLGLFDDEDGAA